MNIEYIVCGCIILVFLLMVIICCLRFHRHKKARCLVHSKSDEEKLREINEALRGFGFAYDLSKDIFYSLEDAWQRKMGYGKIYDEMAPSMNMVIDCEPIYFDYGDKSYLIELWKGQYGITTGAEIGIYTAELQEKEPDKIFYHAAEEEEELLMNMTLWKNGRKLFQRGKIHWWLTGFVLGEFSYPAELMLEVSLSFTEPEMLDAFVRGCYRAGYLPDNLHIWCNRVEFRFKMPKTKQPSKRKCRRRLAQWQNRRYCRIYCRVTKCFQRTIDKLYYLMQAYPGVFRIIVKLGRIGSGRK